MEKRLLGKTGIEVSKAGFGVLTMAGSQLNLPVEQGAALICRALKRGINFFDTAQYYKAYDYLSRGFDMAKTECPDAKPVVSTKSYASTYAEMEAAIREVREALGLDVIDVFLLHEVRSDADWESRAGAWKCLKDSKAACIIKAIGISTHHIDMAQKMAETPECDVVFPLINYASMGIRKGDGFGTCQEMAAAIKALHDAGKGVFVMKAFGGGNLTGSYQKALDYVYSLEGVDSVMIGIGKEEELEQLVEYAEGRMDKSFQPDISLKKVRVDLASCEGCGNCKEKCPNKAIHWGSHGLAEVDHEICLTCGYCAPVCPVRAIVMY